MSKLFEALKRAEQLRKQKLAQDEAAKIAISDGVVPPEKQLEAALIAEEVLMAARRVHQLYEEEKRKKNLALAQIAETQSSTLANEAKTRAERELAEELIARRQAEEQVAASATADRNTAIQASSAAEARCKLELQANAAAAQRLVAEHEAHDAVLAREASKAALTQAATERAANDREVAAAIRKRIAVEEWADRASNERLNAEKLAAQAAAARDEAERQLKLHDERLSAESVLNAQQISAAITLRTDAEAALKIEMGKQDALRAEEKTRSKATLAQEQRLHDLITRRIQEQGRANVELQAKLAAEKNLTEIVEAKARVEQGAISAAEKLADAESQLAAAASVALAGESENLRKIEQQRAESETQLSAKIADIQVLKTTAESAAAAALAKHAVLQDDLNRRNAEREKNERQLLDAARTSAQIAQHQAAQVSTRLVEYGRDTEEHIASLRANAASALSAIEQERAALEQQLVAELAQRQSTEARLQNDAAASEAELKNAIVELTLRLTEQQELTKQILDTVSAENVTASASLATQRAELEAAVAEHRKDKIAQERLLEGLSVDIANERLRLDAERASLAENTSKTNAAFLTAEERLQRESADLRAARIDAERAVAKRLAAEQQREADLIAQANAIAKLAEEEVNRATAEAAAESAALAEATAQRQEHGAFATPLAQRDSNPLIQMKLPPPILTRATPHWLPRLPAMALAVAIGTLLGAQLSRMQSTPEPNLSASPTPAAQSIQPSAASVNVTSDTNEPIRLKLDTSLRVKLAAKP